MEFNEAFENLKSKFTSGNSIDVERTTILHKEWDALLTVLLPLLDKPKCDACELYYFEYNSNFCGNCGKYIKNMAG